jgi:RNA polymerase sigma-70 factor (ECF subfamily)
MSVSRGALGNSHPSGSVPVPVSESASDGDSGANASEDQIRWLVDTYGNVVYRVAYAIVGDASLAEDVVQECLVKAWTSMPSWEGDVPVRWIRRVARNIAVSNLRKSKRLLFVDDVGDRAGDGADIHRVVEGRERVRSLAIALAQLDERSRTLLILRESDQLSYEEIAETMDMTTSAVKAKLYRARHFLRVQMEEWDQ